MSTEKCTLYASNSIRAEAAKKALREVNIDFVELYEEEIEPTLMVPGVAKSYYGLSAIKGYCSYIKEGAENQIKKSQAS